MRVDLFPATLEQNFGPVQAIDLALFAAAAGDHNPLHLDEQVARSAGFERPLVHGMLTMAYVGRLFTATFGAGTVEVLQTRFTGSAARGDTLQLRAELQESTEYTATYSIDVRTDCGKPVATGSVKLKRQCA